MDDGDLTPDEKKFVAAFVTTARRDAYMANIHAGLGLNRNDAMSLLATPRVRHEVERLSMAAKIIDGKLQDVKPLHPLTETPSVKPVNEARRVLLDALRGQVQASAQNAVTGDTEAHSEIDPETKLDGTAGRKLLTDKGEVAGSAKELYNRVALAKRIQQRDPDPTERDGLEDRLERSQQEGVAHTRGDGALYVYDKKLATPYDVKRFLSEVMNGDHTVNVTTRLQAAALLGKAYGMFDVKTIEREKQLDKLTPDSVEDIQAKIAQTRAELKRLKGETTDDTQDVE